MFVPFNSSICLKSTWNTRSERRKITYLHVMSREADAERRQIDRSTKLGRLGMRKTEGASNWIHLFHRRHISACVCETPSRHGIYNSKYSRCSALCISWSRYSCWFTAKAWMEGVGVERGGKFLISIILGDLAGFCRPAQLRALLAWGWWLVYRRVLHWFSVVRERLIPLEFKICSLNLVLNRVMLSEQLKWSWLVNLNTSNFHSFWWNQLHFSSFIVGNEISFTLLLMLTQHSSLLLTITQLQSQKLSPQTQHRGSTVLSLITKLSPRRTIHMSSLHFTPTRWCHYHRLQLFIMP